MGLDYYAIAVNEEIKEIVSSKWAKESALQRYKRMPRKQTDIVYAFPATVDDYVRYNFGAKLYCKYKNGKCEVI
jgi:hypothetical protein